MLFSTAKNGFIIPILSLIGFITNLLSTIVFCLVIKNGQRDDMYKHLLFKSICEVLGCFFSIFGSIYYGNNVASNALIMVVWLNWFQKYIIKALFMASTGFEILATFNCAISIEKQMKWCEKKLPFWFSVIFILILSFGVEIFPIFANNIKKFTNIDQFNKTVNVFYNLWPNNLNSKTHLFGLGESIIKEVLFLLILLSLNCYILYKLIQIGKRKKRLNTNSSNIQNSTRAENRKIIMIIVLFLIFLLGHLPNVVYFSVNTTPYSTIFWTKFKGYGEIFLYFSYSISFFVYFAFNSIFRRFFSKLFILNLLNKD
jgi:hypothetical protein